MSATQLVPAHGESSTDNELDQELQQAPQWFRLAWPQLVDAFNEMRAEFHEILDDKSKTPGRRLLDLDISTAKRLNGISGSGDNAVYEVVPFPDGKFPDDYKLPLLTSPKAIRELSDADVWTYYRRYRNSIYLWQPGGNTTDDYRRFIFRAIGVDMDHH